ncbi:hypothetical protein ACQP1W_32810 [Spirillospora sp. CA-255316]
MLKAEELAASGRQVYQRCALVKRNDGRLEIIRLYVVPETSRYPTSPNAYYPTSLIDSRGRVYAGGLEDFRQHNELLDHRDYLLVARNVSAVLDNYEIVVVSGHTPPNRMPLIIGSFALVALIAFGVGARLIRARRQETQPRNRDS